MPVKTTPTLTDIARECRLSKGSVSRALSMSADDCPLNPATRLRVIEVAKAMGYRVNAHARALSRGKSQTIGLTYEGTLPLLDGVYHTLMETLIHELHVRNYDLALVPIDRSKRWEDTLLTGRVDGCISFHSLPRRLVTVAGDIGVPLVLLNGRSDLADTVSPNDRQGARLAVEHLAELGHRRIVMYANIQNEDPHYSIEERHEGFVDAVESLGDTFSHRFFEGEAEEVAAHFQSAVPAPTAVVTYSHYEAMLLLKALRQAGLRVPHDVSLLSFNDVFPAAELDPALTVISVPSVEMGRTGAKMLLDRIEQPEGTPSGVTSLMLNETLIARESTAPLRSESAP
ncbi:MAG: LacI family DNA-binding transcriptional regulator [Phycisphaeraceae bacterium]